jgi:hypothetical protein
MFSSVRLDEKSPTACVVTSWRDRIHVCWVGTDMRLNLASSPDGRRFEAKRTLPYRPFSYDNSSMDDSFSDMVVTAPALAAAPEHLYVAWTGTKAEVTLLAADDFAPTALKHRSTQSPAVAVAGSAAPVLAWTGKGRRVNVLTWSGDPAAAPVRLTQARSNVAPALCGHRGAVVLAWTGTDRRVNVLTLHERGTGTHLRLEQARTLCAPAICSHQGAVLVAWTGTDRRVNLMTVAENRATEPVRLDEARTSFAPAVCTHRGGLVLVWTGSDTRLNVAQLPGA